jgi:hypothetical protein
MPRRTLVVPGTEMQGWVGVEVWQSDNGTFQQIPNWNWSSTPHQHYEVFVDPNGNGSYWVPVSTSPPGVWGGSTLVEPHGTTVNPNSTEYRPNGTYIWIPNNSIPAQFVPGQTADSVICNHPNAYPPA